MRKALLALTTILLVSQIFVLEPPASAAPGMVVEEYKIGCYEPGQPIPNIDRRKLGIFKKREKWRARNSSQYDLIGSQLKKYGYELRRKDTNHGTFYDLYLKQSYFKRKLVLANIQETGQFSTNEDHTHFLFVFDTNEKRFILRDGKLSTMEERMASQPILVKDSLVRATLQSWTNSKKQHFVSSKYAVKKDDKVVYRFALDEFDPGDGVHSLFSYNDHWVMEYDNHVVIDGSDIGKKNGYSKVFSYYIIGGKPFYFFEKNGVIRISYNGKTLPYEYSGVVHYLCCEPAMYDAGHNQDMVWFYAQKDGFWYYVEAGIYD